MDRDLMRRPLTHAVVLLWLLGLGQAALWVARGQPLTGLSVSLLAGTVLSLLLAGRWRLTPLVAVAVVAGLGATLSLAGRAGQGGVGALAGLVAAYGLAAWLLALWVRGSPLAGQIGRVLWPGAGGEAQGPDVDRVVAGTGLALSAVGLLVAGLAHPGPDLPPAPAVALVLTGLHLALVAGRYRQALPVYPLAGLAAWGALTASAAALDRGVLLQDPVLGLVLAASGLACRMVGRLAAAAGEGTGHWTAPLARSAVALAVIGAGQEVLLALAGGVAPAGWLAVAALGAAAVVLLLPGGGLPGREYLGAPLALLALLWGYGAAVHGRLPGGLWPGGPGAADSWLALAVLALLFAAAGGPVRRAAASVWPGARPLHLAATLACLWALSGVLGAMLAGAPGPGLHWASAATLAVGLFPLLAPLGAVAPAVRGVALPLLASLSLWLGLVALGRADHWPAAAVAWGFALWGAGSLLLPGWNARLPGWALAPQTWPWLGLVAVGAGLAGGWGWGTLLAAAAYLLLMQRASAWAGFSWLAVVALTGTALALGLDRQAVSLAGAPAQAIGPLALQSLLLANLLLLAVPVWRRHGSRLAGWLGWRREDLDVPLAGLPPLLAGAWLVVLGLAVPAAGPELLAAGAVLLTLLHALLRRPEAGTAAMVPPAALLLVVGVWQALHPFSVPLLLALWAACVVAAERMLAARTEVRAGLLGRALVPWVRWSPLTALLALGLEAGHGERLVCLALLAASTAWTGWARAERRWLYLSAALAVLLLHGLWLAPSHPGAISGALPWLALQLVALVWMLGRLRRWLAPRLAGAPPVLLLDQALGRVAPALAILALAEWLLHGALLVLTLAVGAGLQWHAWPWDALAALACGGWLAGMALGQARRSAAPVWVYLVFVLTGLTGAYLRVLWLGLAPPGIWDTAALMLAGFAALYLQRLTGSAPVLHLTLALPLLALLTVPLQLGSGHAALTLLAAAALYLLAPRPPAHGLSLYLALLAMNAAVYLWVPQLALRSGLLQVYLIPASLSVLALLQVHRRELRPSVLNGARLAALSTLYAAATLDVFLSPELGVLLLALGLSLAGVGVGIALRTRAFLYAGVAFLVLNVLGQLVRMYPEQRLARALVLMGLGAGITGLMLWFNVKRESLLKRMSVLRADLQIWS